MFTDVHANHLRDQLQAAEDVSKGWGLLLDYAVPRCPQAILDNLRGMLGEAEREAEGWRGLHNYADAHKTLSFTGQPGLGGYTTGARMDPPILLDVIVRPCACGDPALEGEHHRDGRPCHLSRPESTVSLLVGGPQQPASMFEPPVRAPESNPYPSPPDGGTRVFPAAGPFGGPLPEGQEKALANVVSDHLAQDHAEALEQKAKRDRRQRP